MKLANVNGRAAIVINDRVLDIEQASAGELGYDLALLYDLDQRDRLAALVESADVDSLPVLDPASLGAPVPRPSKLVAMALSYVAHAVESGKELPDQPHVMVKFPSSITGPYDEIVIPSGHEMIDYEAEMVIVIGRRFKAISEADAWSMVAGVTCGQDISDRGEQFRPPIKQFSYAKSYDTFTPMGPYLVSVDEFADRDDIGLTGWVSGEQRQRTRTSDLIFSVPALLAWLSRFVTFEPGDVILTGTPGGVGEAQQKFLRAGDVVETEVEGVGRMRNPVVER